MDNLSIASPARGGLLKNRSFINDESTNHLIPFTVWQQELDQLKMDQPQHGVILPSDCEYQDSLAALLKQPIIAIFFEKFNDGRGYSLARLLREAGFCGELRATGDILVDQIFYLKRCGFDAFQLRSDQKQTDAISALDSFSISYQTSADQCPPIYRQE